MIINEIKEYQFDRNLSAYIGNLRNEKLFNIDDFVFVGIGKETLIRCQIVGVEKMPSSNPEYLYKIKLPRQSHLKFADGSSQEYFTMNCTNLFRTIEEAKQSQIQKLEQDYKREKKNIEDFFNQFKEQQ